MPCEPPPRVEQEGDDTHRLLGVSCTTRCGSQTCGLLPQPLPRHPESATEANKISFKLLMRLAPGVGLEPTTERLTVASSTN